MPNRRVPHKASVLLCWLMAAAWMPCAMALGGAGKPPAADYARAVSKALDWLEGRGATLLDGGARGLVEEIGALYTVFNGTADPERRRRYRDLIARRHVTLVMDNKVRLRTRRYFLEPWAPASYLMATHVASRLGLDTTTYRGIVGDLLAGHRQFYPPAGPMRLWVTAYSERLGYHPAYSLRALANRSMLHRDYRKHILQRRLAEAGVTGADRSRTVDLLYGITYEIMALTDFGALDPPPVVRQYPYHYAGVMEQGMRWAVRAGAVDVLAALAAATLVLELPETPMLSRALRLILDAQTDDGSFGETGRGRRHGVAACLVAMALAESAGATAAE